MEYRRTFFDPMGRMGPKAFARAYILLTGLMLLILTGSVLVSPSLGILQYALIFPYLSIFSKRLHDAGLSAWLWPVFLIGAGIANLLSTAFLMPVLAPDVFELQQEIQGMMESQGLTAAMDELSRQAPEIARLSATVSLASFLVSSALVGFVAFGLRPDPGPNRHGPA